MFYSNLQEFVNRFRHLFFVVVSLVAVVCIYALLSFVFVGRTDAVPLKWQKHLEISQKELYSNLDNFSIVGVDRNVIRSNADNATIKVDLRDRASNDYKRVVLVASVVNASNWYKSTWVSAVDSSGKAISRGFSRLRDGFNSSRIIKTGVLSQITINVWNIGGGFSMNLEQAYLSKYPVLPDTFITPFILLSLFAVLITWCCLYKGLYSWIFARSWALFILILVVQLLIMSYYRWHSNEFIGEEFETIMNANNSNNGNFIIAPQVDAGNVWHSSQEMFEAITAQPSEGLSHLNKLRARFPLHSPTRFIQLHLAFMLFPNTFSYWYGMALNALYYIGICILMYVISRRFLSDRLALLPMVFYGFSAAGLYTPIFARSYTAATFFCVLLIYLALEIFTQPKLTKKIYILLALSAFLGIDAHSFCAVWLAGISIVPIYYLFMQKRFVEIAKCAIALIVGISMYSVFVVHPFPASDRANAIGSISIYFKTLPQSLLTTFYYLLGWGGILCLLVIVVAVVLSRSAKVQQQKTTALLCLSIALATSVYLLAHHIHTTSIGLFTWQALPLAAPLALLFTLFLNELVSKKLFAGVILVVAFFGFLSRVEPQKILLYYPDTNYAEVARTYRNVPAIWIGIAGGPPHEMPAIINLREATSMPPDDVAAFNRALEHIKDDDSVIIYFAMELASYKDTVLNIMRSRGYTEQVPFIDGVSWVCSK
ncbi:hypothetical protein RsTz2092_09210 [Deferribacterales bacterium RsTz2092]|nr:hypothetical protein AGMMS49941_07080 [Deferribacterales bacterium]